LRAVCAVCAFSGAAALTVASCSTPAIEPTPDAAPPAPVDSAPTDASAASLQPPGWDDGLRLPGLEDLDSAPDVVEVRLEAKVAPVGIGGQTLPMWTYDGLLPGPVLRAKRGDRVLVHFKNSLPAPTTIHWHGLRVPNVMDGVPDVTQAPIPPGGTFDYEFRVPDAGTFWYHPHVASSTQVGYGLYGALVVEERDEEPAPSPVVPASDELTLVLSDVSITDAGALETPDATGGLGDYFGREGRPLVNGRVRASLKARPGLPQRWRVVNASRAHYAALELPGFDVYRLGGDVGLAETARRLPFGIATVVPGERVELFVVPRGAAGQSIVATWNTVDRLHTTAPPEKTPVLDITLEGEPVVGRDLPPPKLAAFEPVTGVDASAPPARALAFVDDRGALSMAPADMFTVRARTSEVWTVANMTGQDHPFHLHGFAFQVLDTGSGPPAQRELRDTVNVVARQRITIAIPFDDRAGTWMFHCHILDHADVGMMGMFMVR